MTTLTISLPDQVATAIDQAIQVGGFASRSEFIRSLLRQHFQTNTNLQSFKPIPIDQVRQDLTATGKYSQQFVNSLIAGLEKSSAYAPKTTKK